jgi:alpha-1,2-mannosyltransferase
MNENQKIANSLNWRNEIIEPGIERLIISIIFNCIFGLAVLVGLKSLGIVTIAAIILAIISALTGVILLTKRLPVELVGIKKQKPLLSIVWLVMALITFVMIGRLSVFMIDPTLSQFSLFPGDKWMVEHCCLTAYSESARLTEDGEVNIYRSELYTGTELSGGNAPRRKIENFTVDAYHYPPPFLLLPLMARTIVSGDFLNLRMLWFSISLLSLMTAIGFIVYRLEPNARMRMIGLSPLILCSMPVLSGLQMSNVQIIVISISIIAMSHLPRQYKIGSLLLAMSTVAKIFPGILFVYILFQRKFREALWIAGLAIVLSIIAFIVVGPNPFQAFIEYELPKLSSGEAFSRPFSNAFAVARNMAPFGIPLKLGWVGVPGMTLEVGQIVSSIHLLMVIILAIWSGRQKSCANTEMISVWISLIALGSLVSPFAPANYVLVSVILLVCLNREFFRPLAVIIIWLIICVPFFISREAPFLVQALFFLPSQFIAIAIPAFVLYRAGLRTTVRQNVLSKSSIATEVSTD